ncbi:MAG TPA: winged helix-turn-helix domain-containing protein, partial [Candidatus Competibacteraceae bacterium]|nr:winged helix-turn-helix domain-containing protein [Candidatus Competibacteraceae bacterium]
MLKTTPADHGYDTVLWTLDILVHLLSESFGIGVSDATVRLHLHELGLSCQKPCYRAINQDKGQVKKFVNEGLKRFRGWLCLANSYPHKNHAGAFSG